MTEHNVVVFAMGVTAAAVVVAGIIKIVVSVYVVMLG